MYVRGRGRALSRRNRGSDPLWDANKSNDLDIVSVSGLRSKGGRDALQITTRRGEPSRVKCREEGLTDAVDLQEGLV
jgi:hypothetical protein